MIILAGTFRIAPEKRELTLELMREMVTATRAEPGCVQYAFALDVQDDLLVRVFEVFKDEAALEQHRASEHMARWRARGPELGLSGRDLAQYLVAAWQKI